mmetsp:Transcript_31485/g.66887  ORF Transcript_31485/g.66887 Transcript_31485/m.66887 type:complete len:182 (+) Transcript_31485:64-609(+)|eukprot:CAMPEP_0206583544 /NCGR_PEP_ID=MMETSP0325_2-20121206/35170_1 /ASSEMBLY_ACC=CAM_ASM_000347 /TAXON_ID=2866 /ORGANISM="Crypthecodinium cohnii, Strain Seligo" /LENGTH=181 /DNA_ID=CAMNT_0054090491 /DNA_START=37 /DNA_END=582 /DNA_ORIENTATION=+
MELQSHALDDLTPQFGLAPTAAADVRGGVSTACPAMLSGYERKMMRRLEIAQRKAQYAAAGVPLPPGSRLECKAGSNFDPKPKPKDHTRDPDPDPDRLARLAWEARQKGHMFFCFPSSLEQLKQDAATLDRFVKDEESEDNNLTEQRKARPDRGLGEFLDRLETMQQLRQQQQEQDNSVSG